MEGSGMVDICILEKENQTAWGERIRGIKLEGREQGKLRKEGGDGARCLQVFSEHKARPGNTGDVTVE